MSRRAGLLLVSLLLAIVLTAAFRFVQHADHEYAFWVAIFGATATQLEARCAASKSPDVCARARERRSFADEFRIHRDAVMAWWWPALLAMTLAWLAVVLSLAAVAIDAWRRRRLLHDPSQGQLKG